MSGIAFFLLGVAIGVASSFALLLFVIFLDGPSPPERHKFIRENFKGVRGRDGN